jgi:hypothetical protein
MRLIHLVLFFLILFSMLACNLLTPKLVTPEQAPLPPIVTETRTPIVEWLTTSPTIEMEETKSIIILGAARQRAETPETPTSYVSPGQGQLTLTVIGIAYPIKGSVLIEDGRCCVGGVAGSEIQINVAFQATSFSGEGNQMRVLATGGGCHREDEMDEANWEPFVPAKTYPFYPPINWVGFYVSVQYRDTSGNISSVYCDNISVEGSPPLPTP